MWLDKLNELKKEKGLTKKQIADKTGLPERTIIRILAGETDNPYLTTLIPIVNALGGSLDDIFADTKVVVATETVAELQENVEVANAKKDLVLADYEILKEKYETLVKELDLTKVELAYTKKLLAVHEYYTKLKSE